MYQKVTNIQCRNGAALSPPGRHEALHFDGYNARGNHVWRGLQACGRCRCQAAPGRVKIRNTTTRQRSEEHTSELQSQSNLVCRLLLEKKKKKKTVRSRVVQRNTKGR